MVRALLPLIPSPSTLSVPLALADFAILDLRGKKINSRLSRHAMFG
jgi:hypothetical protein